MKIFLRPGLVATGCNSIGKKSERQLEETLAAECCLGLRFCGIPTALCPACTWLLQYWQQGGETNANA